MFYQRYEFVSLAILLFIWLEWLSRLGTVANLHWIFRHILCFYNHQYSFGKKSYQLPEKKTIKSAKNLHRLRATWPRGDRNVFTVPFQNYLYIGVSYHHTRLAIRKHKTGNMLCRSLLHPFRTEVIVIGRRDRESLQYLNNKADSEF